MAGTLSRSVTLSFFSICFFQNLKTNIQEEIAYITPATLTRVIQHNKRQKCMKNGGRHLTYLIFKKKKKKYFLMHTTVLKKRSYAAAPCITIITLGHVYRLI